ncbi:redoxin domain-containing protein [Mucilaginibacter sp. CSA2-8R]|uniref:TlpA family protein disulfide reductase n=1 Tax=Mucilaginibacter sp. CSA2-8R TaxID=3141542 RepID=UPI00315D439E
MAVASLFWYNDYIYNLPTPVPAGYVKVNTGQHIKLGKSIAPKNGKPLLLHFFNPDCPCSRFNIKHFKTLISTYGDQTNFVVVLMNNSKYSAAQVKEKFNLSVPVIDDAPLAKSCGVYSTPQAAIIDVQGKLYYRGNYNTTRYCTNTKTEFARIALDSLLNHKGPGRFNRLAATAYGCSLPKCIK